MTESWREAPISTIATGIYDGPHATPKPSSAGPVFLGIRNLTEDGRLDLREIRHISEAEYPRWTKRVTPQAGDIVFTYEASLNRYAVIPPGFRGCLGRRVALIRPDESQVDRDYLFYYFFTSEWRDLISRNILSGATVDRIPIEKFPSFPVRLPSLAVQRRIGSSLRALDRLSENAEARSNILAALPRFVYEEWFVRRRFPGFRSSDQDAAAELPAGWRMVRLGEICNALRGRAYSSSDLAESGGLPFLNLKCIDRDGGFRRDGLKSYTGSYRDTNVARPGDVVVAVTDVTQARRLVAHAARVPDMGHERFVVSMDLVRLDPAADIPREFLYASVRYSEMSTVVKEHANGANVLHLNPDRILDYEIPLPTPSLVRAYADLVAPMFRLADVLANTIRCAAELRQLALPGLMNGSAHGEEEERDAPH